MKTHQYQVGDTIRMKDYPTAGGWRAWKVVGHHLGALYQEGTYALKPIDVSANESIQVPCIMLETHPEIERV